MEAQVEAHASDDPHWRAVGLVMAQSNGLVEGYQARARQASSSAAAAVPGRRMASAAPADAGSVGWLDRADLVFLNNNGELYDIIDHLQDRKQAGLLGPGERRTVRPDQVFDIIALRGRCSALIKVGPTATCHSGYMALFLQAGLCPAVARAHRQGRQHTNTGLHFAPIACKQGLRPAIVLQAELATLIVFACARSGGRRLV